VSEPGLLPVGLTLGLTAGLAAALVSALAAWLLVRLARWAGWIDGEGVAIIGGPAVLGGLLFAGGLLSPQGLESSWAGAAAVPALLLALAVGIVDDLLPGGLSPLQKVVGQLVAAGPLVLLDSPVLLGSGEWLGGAAWAAVVLLGAVLVLNLLNTYDNSDGAAVSLGLLALAAPLPAAAGALGGFLPFNLGPSRRGGRPAAYLGDSGSHLLGMLVVLSPAAWPALALPALDLSRLSVERWLRGSRPWIGDREHLAHRLEARGLRRGWILAALLGVSMPSIVLGGLGGVRDQPSMLIGGLAGTAFLYLIAWRGSLAVEPPGSSTA